MTATDKSLRLVLILTIAIGFFYHLGSVPLFDLDEGAFSEATREMFQRGDFISPYLNGAPRYDKPALIHWLQAISVSALGWNELALRLPSAFAATLWVLAVYGFVWLLRDERTGLCAAIAMAGSLEISVMAKAATADAVLNLFIACAVLSAYMFHHSARRRWLYGTFLCMGLGFLTKGPVAVLVVAATTGLFYLSRRDLKAWLRAAFDPRGLLLFLAVALPWYLAQYLKEGDAFLQGFFLKHNIGRFEQAMEGHRGGLLYYIPVVLIGVLPYTTVLLSVLRRAGKIWREDLGRYLLIWFTFVFVFFSLSGTKLPHYVVYGYTGLFVLMAGAFDRLPRRGWLFLPPLLLFILLLFLPELLGWALPRIHDPFVQARLADYRQYFSLGYRLYFAVACLLMPYFMWERRFSDLGKLMGVGLLTVFALAQYVLPVVGAIQQQPIKEAALLAKRRHLPVVMWGLNTPSFSVYSNQVVARRDPRPGDVVLTRSTYLHRLSSFEVLYQKNGIALVRVLAGAPAVGPRDGP